MFNNAITKKMNNQITNNIMMIRPVSFRYNEETALNNYYQKVLDNMTPGKTQELALKEFDQFVSVLQEVGVNVIVFNDSIDPDTPDSIFPNNWVSFHSNGIVNLYPMCANNRRFERRTDILDVLVSQHN